MLYTGHGMKQTFFILVSIMLPMLIARATDGSDDPLLDAKIEVIGLKLHYTEEHPKMIEAEIHLNAMEKTYSETPADYRAHLIERIQQAEVEDADLSLRYTALHPRRIAVETKLKFLRQELQRTGGTS